MSSELSSLKLELDYMQRLLACLVYEKKYNLIEADSAPSDIFDRLATLIGKAPPSVVAQTLPITSSCPAWPTRSGRMMRLRLLRA
jgi:hypothetical protein